MRILIVGAGIFGMVLAKVLKSEGYEIHVADDNREGSGSSAAGCLMKPSWVSELSKEQYSESMSTLESIVNVKDVPFLSSFSFGKFSVNAPKLVTDVRFTNPEELLGRVEGIQFHDGEIVRIAQEGNKFTAIMNDPSWGYSGTAFDKVFVCAGVWSRVLVRRFITENSHRLCDLTGMTGASVRWSPAELSSGHMSFYTPYKQAVVFNIARGVVWGGDNCTVSSDKYNEEFKCRTVERCMNLVIAKGSHKTKDFESLRQQVTVGHRPFVKHALPSLVEEIIPGLWVNTGGAKNGTLAAGWAANKILAGLRAGTI
jgi:glycine/D-amino acid oxidase-like deaminating enzyme